MAKFVLDILLKNSTYRAISSYGNLELFSNDLNYKAEVETVKYWENDEISI